MSAISEEIARGSSNLTRTKSISDSFPRFWTSVIGIFLFSKVAVASVIGEDTRQVRIDTTQFPASAVVQLLIDRHSERPHLCSGAMISPNMLLTAAHCLHSGTSNGRWVTDIIAYPGRNVGSLPFGSCKGRRMWVRSGWKQASSIIDAKVFDIGAVELDCDVGSRTGWFGIEHLDSHYSGTETILAGYASDKVPAGRQWVTKDQAHEIWESNIFHEHDTFGGTGGSPITTVNKPDVLIAIQTSGLHGQEPWASHNSGVLISESVLIELKSAFALGAVDFSKGNSGTGEIEKNMSVNWRDIGHLTNTQGVYPKYEWDGPKMDPETFVPF